MGEDAADWIFSSSDPKMNLKIPDRVCFENSLFTNVVLWREYSKKNNWHGKSIE